jgi:predicted O-methyltransferase YrrM
MDLLPAAILVIQLALAAGLVLLWRQQRTQFDKVKHIVRTEMRRAADAEALRAEGDRVVRRLGSDLGKRMRKEALGTGQQIEWRAHLAELVDLPFGALPATRHWAASPDFLVHLAERIRADRPEVVVECGAGVSTLVIARALQLNGTGTVWTLESDERFAEQTRQRLRVLGCPSQSKVLHAPLAELPGSAGQFWYRLAEVQRLPAAIDLLVVDGPQVTEGVSRAPAISHLFPRLKPAGAALFDDARRAEEMGFPELVAARFPGWRRFDLPAEKGAFLFLGPGRPGP